MFRIIKVSGESMSPEFNDGDYVLLSRLPLILGMIKINSTLVFKSAEYGILIKKVSDIDRHKGTFFFTGINKNSLTSEKIGAIPRKSILGSVILHFKKPVA
jgi:signal peptidase I